MMLIRKPKIIFALIVFLACFQVIFNPLRLLGIYNTAPLNLSIIYGIGLLSVLFLISTQKSLSKIEFFLLFLVILNLIYAIIIGNEPSKIITGFIRPIFFIAIIKLFSCIDVSALKINFPARKHVNWIFLSYMIGVIITAYIYFFIGGIRASASAIPLAIPLFYFLINKSYLKFLVVVLLFLIGGKFGPLLGVSASIYLMLFFNMKKLFISIFIMGIFYIILSVAVNNGYLDLSKVPVLAKLNTHQLVEKDWELDLFDAVIMGGRISEALSALGSLHENNSLASFLFGGGLGYTYTWESISGNIILLENRGVHFTPIAIYIEYGLLFSVTLFLYLFSYLRKSIRVLINYSRYNDNYVLWCAFFVASFINMLTAFSLFTNLFLAVSIGVLQIKNNNKRQVTS